MGGSVSRLAARAPSQKASTENKSFSLNTEIKWKFFRKIVKARKSRAEVNQYWLFAISIQFIWFCLSAIKEQKEGDTLLLVGEEKARRSVRRYFESLDPKSGKSLVVLNKDNYYFKEVEGGLNTLKHSGKTTTWINYDTTFKSDFENKTEIINQSTPKKLKLLEELNLAQSRATLLICIQSDKSYTDSELEWIRDFEKGLKNVYTNRFIVFTDCTCLCMGIRKIPYVISHIPTGVPILHRVDDKRIDRLLCIKYTGNSDLLDLVGNVVYFFCGIKCGSLYKDMFVKIVEFCIPRTIHVRNNKVPTNQFKTAFSRWCQYNMVDKPTRKPSLADKYKK